MRVSLGFNEGTGLGMNLVATIIRAIGGKIEVQSEQGVGTTVTVQVPLDEVKQGHSRSKTDTSSNPIATTVPKDLTIAMPIVPGDRSSSKHNLPLVHTASQAMLIGSISKTCGDLGIRTVGLDRSSDEEVGILFSTEEQISGFHGQVLEKGAGASDDDPLFGRRAANIPLVILCGNTFKLRAFRASHADLLASRNVELISQPAGPECMAKAVRTCLDRRARQKELGTDEGASRSDPAGERQAVDVGTGVAARRSSRGDSAHQNANSASHAQSKLGDDAAGPPVDDSKPNSAQAGSDIFASAHSSSDREQKPPDPSHPASPPMVDGGPRTDALASRPIVASRTSSGASSGLTIMLVDDNAINLQLLTVYAKRHGHVYIQAHNGRQALDAYEAACTGQPLPPPLAAIQTAAGATAPQKPRVVLMDINMPVLNGYEATRAIREFENRNHLPPTTVVALTGLGSAQAQQEAYSSGIDLFLTKPVKLKELGQILESVDRG